MTKPNRNLKTNAFLAIVSDILTAEKKDDHVISITLGVNGLLITGELISAEEFFELETNKPFSPIYEKLIKLDAAEYFDENGNVLEHVDANDIPDHIWQRFIYLKNARYITGSNFIPSCQYDGTSVQIRASDVSSLSLTSFTNTNT